VTTLAVQRFRPIAVAALAAIFVAVMGATITDLGPWYQQLTKPSWQPPDWLFGPAWTLIFALAALSAVEAWRGATGSSRSLLVGLFCLNGFLNVLWSLLFFRLQRPDLALYEVVLLWLSILWLILVLPRYSVRASRLLFPYLLWVSFAAILNLAVVRLNAPF
jgi:tryptophan-rich sensory protein